MEKLFYQIISSPLFVVSKYQDILQENDAGKIGNFDSSQRFKATLWLKISCMVPANEQECIALSQF